MRKLIVVAALGCAAVTVGGCSSSSGSTGAASGTSATSSSASTAVSPPAGSPTASSPASGVAIPPSPTASPAASPTATAAAQTAADTFIADGQNLQGTPLYKPACTAKFSCQLSGDSTAYLSDMTWSTWTTSEAAGTGTYKLNACTPNCATGGFYSVPVVVTFSKPVKACSGGTTRWLWTYASFTFPKGLPSALQGQNGPQNPWSFSALASSAQQSCG
jgi:hypothetical protein